MSTGYTCVPPASGLVRVTIPLHVYKGTPSDNWQFRKEMGNWLVENCWRAEYEYADQVSIYPHAVWIDKEFELIFKIIWAI